MRGLRPISGCSERYQRSGRNIAVTFNTNGGGPVGRRVAGGTCRRGPNSITMRGVTEDWSPVYGLV